MLISVNGEAVEDSAGDHLLTPAGHRITVRSQRSRWGSCSRRGTISLNWRLIQTPRLVQDYIILHELCHLREMNHSRRFWRQVERVCPEFEMAERWLKQYAGLLCRVASGPGPRQTLGKLIASKGSNHPSSDT